MSEKGIQDARRDESRYTAKIEDEEIKNLKKVNLINSLIFRKSFSWMDFLLDLEKGLPNSCTIVSLTPSMVGDSKMEVKLRVTYPGINELLKLIQNFKSIGFKNISIRNETRSTGGTLIAEISVVYERTV